MTRPTPRGCASAYRHDTTPPSEVAEHERDARVGFESGSSGWRACGSSSTPSWAHPTRRRTWPSCARTLRGMSAVVRQARGLAVAVEVQQQHVVSVSIAELRGGVEPTGVVHQPTVEEHHARALAVRGGCVGRDTPTGEEHPETEVVVAIAAAGGGRRRRARRRRVSFPPSASSRPAGSTENPRRAPGDCGGAPGRPIFGALACRSDGRNI